MVGVNKSEDEYFFMQTGVWLYTKVSDDMKFETRVRHVKFSKKKCRTNAWRLVLNKHFLLCAVHASGARISPF